MKMTAKAQDKYVCIREKQINKHSDDIVELKARADFKDQRIDELNKNIHDIDTKLDGITTAINELKLQSSKDDYDIDARVTAIESKIETLKWVIGAVGVLATVLGFVLSHLRVM